MAKRSGQDQRRQAAFDRRVERLRRQAAPIASGREYLDGPVDPAVEAEDLGGGRTRLFVQAGGQRVSQATVIDFAQQIGGQTVRMGGVASVGTAGGHRFRGYSRQVMSAALRWMRQAGFDTSMLYGIPCFYPKFGYAPAFPASVFSLPVSAAKSVPAAGHRFVRFGPKHLSAVLRMYRAGNAGRTGPTERVAGRWAPFRVGLSWQTHAACRVAIDAAGRPAGYWAYDFEEPGRSILEVGWRTPRVFADILRAAAGVARRAGRAEVRFVLAPDDAFMAWCRPLGLRQEITCRRDGWAMIRVINVRTALAAVGPDLAARCGGAGRLNVRTNLDAVGLRWRAGAMTVGRPARGAPTVRLPQWALAQMLYGYASADALAARGLLTGPARAIGALAAMLPVRPHHHYRVDSF